jgi:hypothetical protein
MATRTASVNGNWSNTATWGGAAVPVDGDAVVINVGITVLMNVDQSGFANGLLSLLNNGILHFKADSVSCLKLNGNITGTGKLVAGQIVNSGADPTNFQKTPGYNNVYETQYDNLRDGLVEIYAFRIGSLFESEEYKEVYSLEEVENTPNSYMLFIINGWEGFYLHTSNGDAPTSALNHYVSIKRPDVGSESRAQIIFKAASQTIQLPTFLVFGWYPSRLFTQLNAAAIVNATIIVLNEDLGLQQGDKIAIGSGTEFGNMAESNKGVYTVASYNSGTKTVTLTAGLQTARNSGDYVCWASATVKMSRLAGSTAFIGTVFPTSMKLIGLNSLLWIINDVAAYFQTFASLPGGYILKWCIATARGLIYGANNCTFDYCACVGGGSYSLAENVQSGKLTNCIGINQPMLYDSVGAFIENCVSQNGFQLGSNFSSAKNCKFLNTNSWYVIGSMRFINCIIHANNYLYNPSSAEYINCTFLNNCFNSITGKCFNCVFPTGFTKDVLDNPAHWKLESFDHNQIAGSYYAIMKGGKIITENNKLKFTCQSASYPIFKDYHIMVQKNVIERFSIAGTKDFLGGTVKAELIDPANDPLIDPTATVLATSSMANVKDTYISMNLNYNPTKAQELILRILVKNNTGNYILKELVRFNRRSREIIQ